MRASSVITKPADAANPKQPASYLASMAANYPPAAPRGDSPLAKLAQAHDACWEAVNLTPGDVSRPAARARDNAYAAVLNYAPRTHSELVEKTAILAAGRFTEDDVDRARHATMLGKDAGRLLADRSLLTTGTNLDGLAAAYFAANDAFCAACKATDIVVIGREPTAEEGEAWEAACNADEAALLALLIYRPRNAAEAARKAAYCEDARVSLNLTSGLRSALLAASAATGPEPAAATAAAGDDEHMVSLADEIAHLVRREAETGPLHDAICERGITEAETLEERIALETKLFAEAGEAADLDGVHERIGAIQEELGGLTPSTARGLAPSLALVLWEEGYKGPDYNPSLALLKGHIDTLVANEAAAEAEAAMFAGLVQQLEVLAALEGPAFAVSDDEADKACDASRVAADAIMAAPATTLAGFAAKMRAVAWCSGRDEVDHVAEWLESEGRSTGTTFLAQIVRELAAQGSPQ